MLNLNDARFFVKVVEQRGFAPAARALGVPKSTVSKRVAELERSLGVTLIRRTTRRFAVTPIGAAFHQHAAGMVDLADAAEQVVRGHAAEPTGPVNVTCSVPTAQLVLAEVLPSVARRYPKIRIVVHATDRFVDVVRDGFDIAIRDHFDPLPDSSLVQRRIAVDPIVLVTGARYRAPRVTDDLAGHDLLATTPIADWTLRREAETARITKPARFVADETVVLAAAARRGLGIAALPSRLCEAELASKTLRRVLPDWVAGRVTTTMLLPDRRAQLPSVRAVADAIASATA